MPADVGVQQQNLLWSTMCLLCYCIISCNCGARHKTITKQGVSLSK